MTYIGAISKSESVGNAYPFMTFVGMRHVDLVTEMSTAVYTQLTPWPFTKKLKGLSLYSASHQKVFLFHATPECGGLKYSKYKKHPPFEACMLHTRYPVYVISITGPSV